MKTLNGQSLLDLAIQIAGSIEAAFDIAIAKGLSVTDTLDAGVEIDSIEVVNKMIVDYCTQKNLHPATDLTQTALIIAGSVDTLVPTPQNYKSASIVKALANQTVLDLAVQECGNVTAAIDFALKNGLSITDDLIAGNDYKKTDVVSAKIALYFTQRNLHPATGLTTIEEFGIFDDIFDLIFE